MAKRQELMKKMEMPKKSGAHKAADDEMALDFPMTDEEAGDKEADQDSQGMDIEMPAPEDDKAQQEAASKLDDVSDDDLLAEMKKRGLDMEHAADAAEGESAPEAPSEEAPAEKEEEY